MHVLICFSHLRWNFVYQRPQHLLTRLSRLYPVFFIEEPVYDLSVSRPFNNVTKINHQNIHIVVPHLPCGMIESEATAAQRSLLDSLIRNFQLRDYLLWYYSPMALQFSRHLTPRMTVYDCMDELSAFRFAPPLLKTCEAQLIEKADLLFTGGYSLYNAKKKQHANAYCFPSSIDKSHFAQARGPLPDPPDQAGIPAPRLGFFGVIDERFDIALIGELARRRPDWHIVLLGPVVKIDTASLPRHPNIHYLGMKRYEELPAYLAGWDIALLPFALNESTVYISPTKTPEYLAGGKPVISTRINDVVHTYGGKKMVRIADSVDEFIEAAAHFIGNGCSPEALEETDALLAEMSWDDAVQAIAALMHEKIKYLNTSYV